MAAPYVGAFPKLNFLPKAFPIEGAVRLELENGIPVFHASSDIKARVEALIEKEKAGSITQAEKEELDLFEEIDDYLSFINRLVRNQIQHQTTQGA
jgi:uncharacterized protein YnzC (UPF0291/DUF896 family)